ncbi:gag/pol protein [Cucumis melo var. makuwa]|uniref:Gag/pol protein n=1 Tax=Cucumis melo var. makuwa TaxID=1194695 RepID=A0A5D3DWE6_CUCMM|nr:gag/pol protein [Cucumis melo var. makuwa]TYK27610.1 gag/pol protein [Cucumis melo var. makuwa]
MKLLMNQQGLLMKLVPHPELMKPPHQVVIPDDGVEDPLSYKQAMNDVDKNQRVKAMDLELESMYFNSVWKLVDLPERVKPIGCKWNYKRKRDSVGKPERFITQGQEQNICKLNRSIYGFKQEARSWNIRPILNERFERGTICSWDPNDKGSHGVHLSKEQCPKTPQEVKDMRYIPYALAVGSLMYVMLCTRMRDYVLVYGAKDFILTRYTNSDFQTDKDSRKSTSGSVFTLNEVVVWRSIKQGCIADSTVEVEYVAAYEVAK